MSGYKYIILEEEKGVARIILNNPESRNALTEETKAEVTEALEKVSENGDARALIITARDPAFCAGGDVKNIGKELTPEEIREVMKNSQKLLLTLVNLEKPVIAAVNGDAFGMGCNLALAADFRIVSERARFCQVFIKLGLMPDFGALYFLPRLIGPERSKHLVYLGRAVKAEEAEKLGLVSSVVPHEELENESMKLAGKLAVLPTQAIARAKRVLNNTYDMTLQQVLAEEIEAQIYLSNTEDHREGIRTLMKKRKPTFKGQ
jgi:2-(1,2-epoxy-1,2-dihydrophenyl)acetyl-CoA isomerase